MIARRARRPILVAFALLALAGASASEAAAKKVAVGDYQASPAIASTRDYSVGVFSVSKSGGKRQIVRTDGYLGIYYPDANECDDYDVPLAADRVPIGATGRFKHVERTPVEDSFVKVVWRGRWIKPGVVTGSIRIKHAGCTSKRRWSGGKVAAGG